MARGFLITGQVEGTTAVHTGSDIPLSAFGPGAEMFTGVMDNSDVFFKFGQAALRRQLRRRLISGSFPEFAKGVATATLFFFVPPANRN